MACSLAVFATISEFVAAHSRGGSLRAADLSKLLRGLLSDAVSLSVVRAKLRPYVGNDSLSIVVDQLPDILRDICSVELDASKKSRLRDLCPSGGQDPNRDEAGASDETSYCLGLPVFLVVARTLGVYS
jgi:hypothetical protein